MESRSLSHRRRSTRDGAEACLGRSQGPGDASGQAKIEMDISLQRALSHIRGNRLCSIAQVLRPLARNVYRLSA